MNQVAHQVPETAESIPNLVAAIGRALVDYPDRVSVVVTPEQGHSVLLLQVDPGECRQTRWQAGQDGALPTNHSLRSGHEAEASIFARHCRGREHTEAATFLGSDLFPRFQTPDARRSDGRSRRTARERPSELLSPECASISEFRED